MVETYNWLSLVRLLLFSPCLDPLSDVTRVTLTLLYSRFLFYILSISFMCPFGLYSGNMSLNTKVPYFSIFLSISSTEILFSNDII